MHSALTVFTEIGEILTLKGAADKDARRVSEADLSILVEAVLVSFNGKIVWLGSRSEFKSSLLDSWGGEKSAEFVSLNGKTILPSFVECHTHLIFSGNRAHEFEWRIQGQTYQEISAKGGGIRYTVNETRKSSESELLEHAQARADIFLRQGVTTLEAKSGYGLDVETELRSLKVARSLKGPRIIATYLGAHSKSPDFPDLDSYLEMMCEKVLPRVAHEKLAERVDIYIEKGFFTLGQARKYMQKARDLGLGIAAHVEQLSEMGGTDLTLSFAPQSVDHLVFVNDATIRKITESSTTAVLLPGSDFYLRMQYPPARKLIDAGARVAISTDFNPGTSPTQDLSLIGVLSRLEMKMTLPEVLVAYTLGAASALGKARELGSLEVGKMCDFNMLSGSWRDLFYSVGQHPVESVFQAGQRRI